MRSSLPPKDFADCVAKLKNAEVRVAAMLDDFACCLSEHGSGSDEKSEKIFKAELAKYKEVKDVAEFEIAAAQEILAARQDEDLQAELDKTKQPEKAEPEKGIAT